MSHQSVKQNIADYYSQKIQTHGATHQGADWNSHESQWLRFEQLLRGFQLSSDLTFSLNDYGCGYGAFIDFLKSSNLDCYYTGYDLSLNMIQAARKNHTSSQRLQFVTDDQLKSADYTIASGIFNVRLNQTSSDWEDYIKGCLRKMNEASQKGFSFNILTSYSDPPHQKDYLYYANPGLWFDFCKREFSRNVALFHDYDLYEFTISVQKCSG